MRFFKIFVSVLLALIMMITPIMAAPRRTKYVSEVMLAYGDTKDDAIEWLREAGFTDYVDADLNKNSESMYDKGRVVLLGYKTTYNANEAITDLALMNMEGGYSYTSYTQLLEKKKLEIADFVKDFSNALQEYRQNYAAGNKRAIAAFHLLNEFIDDDTGKQIGDLFLNPLLEELEPAKLSALTDEQRKNHADFTTIMLQGNAMAVSSIEAIIAMATDTSADTWLDRLSKLGPEGLLDKYVEEGFSTKEALKEITLDYSDTADILLDKWDDLQEWFTLYKNTNLTPNDSEEVIENYFNKHVELDIRDWAFIAAFYDSLATIPYGEDETMLDLFSLPKEEMEEDEYYQLCTIASVLSPGQKSTISSISLAQLLNIGVVGNDADAWIQADLRAMEIAHNVSEDYGDGTGSADPISVYEGVDRSLFEGNIALTNDALRKESKENSGFYNGKVLGMNLRKLRNIVLAVSVGCAVAVLAIHKVIIPVIWKVVPLKYVRPYPYFSIDRRFLIADKFRDASKYLSIAGVILCTAGLIMTVYDLIRYYENEYVPIPDRIVDERIVEGSYNSVYVYYKAAPCNRNNYYDNNPSVSLKDQEKIMAKLGNNNDIHADLGKVWLSLYYSKDKEAGKPVTADFVVSKNNNVLGYKALHLFGQADAVNLSDSKWCYTDEMLRSVFSSKADPIYVFYGVDSGSSLTGSTFSTGLIALLIGGGLIVGAAGGVLVTMAIIKNKNKKKEAVSES